MVGGNRRQSFHFQHHMPQQLLYFWRGRRDLRAGTINSYQPAVSRHGHGIASRLLSGLYSAAHSLGCLVKTAAEPGKKLVYIPQRLWSAQVGACDTQWGRRRNVSDRWEKLNGNPRACGRPGRAGKISLRTIRQSPGYRTTSP